MLCRNPRSRRCCISYGRCELGASATVRRSRLCWRASTARRVHCHPSGHCNRRAGGIGECRRQGLPPILQKIGSLAEPLFRPKSASRLRTAAPYGPAVTWTRAPRAHRFAVLLSDWLYNRSAVDVSACNRCGPPPGSRRAMRRRSHAQRGFGMSTPAKVRIVRGRICDATGSSQRAAVNNIPNP
jgi:hypothetical protein